MFELNIIITLLLLHMLMHQLFGIKGSSVLSCGLFAFISDKQTGAQKFNWDKFNHLGLDNDERGGDSVGRVVGDQIMRFVNPRKAKTTYQEYVINHKNDEPSHIAIGHTRKASIGVVSEANAQPVVLDLPNGDKFIMVHNGTIYNWEELAKNHGVESAGKTDSMVLAEIIAYQGFDVLKEYTGAAAIIIRDDREPDTIKVFKGESKNYSQKLEEERPLYYYQENETSMYISSKEDGLYFIGGIPDNIVDFNSNTLYTIFEGQIINEEEYDRSDCSSVRVWPKAVNNHAGNVFRTNGYREFDDSEYLRESSVVIKNNTIHKPSMRTDIIPLSSNYKKIIQARLRYYFSKVAGEPCYANGIIKLDEEGVIYSSNSKTPGIDYYFYSGIMLRDVDCYNKCKEEFGKARQFVDIDTNISGICKYAVYPVCTIDCKLPLYGNIKHYELRSPAISSNVKPYYTSSFHSGIIEPLFSYKKYTTSSGELSVVEFKINYNTPNHSVIAICNTKMVASSLFKPVNVNLPVESACSKVTKMLAEKAVNNSFVVDGFIDKKEDSPFKAPYTKAELYEVYCEEDDDMDDVNYNIHNDYAIEVDDLPFQPDAVNDEGDDDEADSDDYVSKAINQGIDLILKSIDEVISELEMLGASGKTITTTLSNFYKLQDPFMDIKQFKKKPLMIGYDDQF